MSAGIALRDLHLRRDDRDLFDGLSADLPDGGATAVVGPSGAGKSTLLSIIAGFEAPDAGSVVNPFALEETGVVLQSYGLLRILTAAENVELALKTRDLPAAEVRARAAVELERLGLAGLADRMTDELSGGQQQRLAIARALVIRPRLVIADELTSELDPVNRDRTLDRILALRQEGVTVVLATHDAAVADRCDHRVVVGASDPDLVDETVRSRRRALEEARDAQRVRLQAQRELAARERDRLTDMETALARIERELAELDAETDRP